MGVCVSGTERRSGVCREGEDDLCAPVGHKARVRATGALPLTMRPEDR